MTDTHHHHITLEMDKLRDAKDHPAKIQVSLCGFQLVFESIGVRVCV